MALTKITPEIVAVNAIQGTLIADNAITAVHIATNAVSGTLIADNAVTATHIAQNVITVTQLADDAVEADKIADGVITTNHLNKAMISSQTEVTAATGDYLLIGDTSDSNNLKKVPVSGVTGLVSSPITALNNATANELVTVGSTTTELDAESGLTWDTSTLTAAGNLVASGADGTVRKYTFGNTSGNHGSIGVDASGHTFIDAETSGGAIYFKDAGTTNMTITSAGSVGIARTPEAYGSNRYMNLQADAGGDAVFNMQGDTTNGGKLSLIAKNNDTAVIWTETNHPLIFGTNQTERMRIDTNGDLLIGQTSQTGYTFAEKLVVGDGDANDGITIQSGSTHQGNLAFNHSDGTTAHGRILYQHNSNYMSFFTNNTERMRITSGGIVGIGTTSPQAGNPTGTGLHVSAGNSGASPNDLSVFNIEDDTHVSMCILTPNTVQGQIRWADPQDDGTAFIIVDQGSNWMKLGANTSVQMTINSNGQIDGDFNDTSDVALKENISDLTGGLSIIKQLRPRNFDWKSSDKKNGVAGFIAQEVETILPKEVNGEDYSPTVKAEDGAVNGITGKTLNVTGIVAHLTKAVQELEARVKTLEG